jgi:hypothetical protein
MAYGNPHTPRKKKAKAYAKALRQKPRKRVLVEEEMQG